MDALLAYLDSIYPLSQELSASLKAVLKHRVLKRKDFLLQAGRVCKEIHFVQRGLLRCWYQKHDHEVSTWFMREGDVVVSVESFFLQRPGYENIQALEETEVYFIDHAELGRLYQQYLEFNFVGRTLLQHYYILSERRLLGLRMNTAAERYAMLMQEHPELLQRVPSQHIASYLGISRETFSRMKSIRSTKKIL